ncbi:MAG: T9SS type A sorting domain-containing protein, partial [Bacteroidota bacterium]
ALSVALLTSEIDSDVETVLAEGSFELELFPNPVSEQLRTTLNLKTPSSYLTYQISDVSGKLLFEHREDSAVQTDQATFDVTRLPQGQYFLKVITEQGFTTKPFVVQ